MGLSSLWAAAVVAHAGLAAVVLGAGWTTLDRLDIGGRVMRAMQLNELDRDDCLRLLDQGVIGRVVYTDAAMPAAQPVNYLLDGQEVVFRTGGGSKLAAATRRAVVAFQADQIDSDTRMGWSVLGVGLAYEVTDSHRLAELAARLPVPWAPHRTAHTIAIPLDHLTGRQLVARE